MPSALLVSGSTMSVEVSSWYRIGIVASTARGWNAAGSQSVDRFWIWNVWLITSVDRVGKRMSVGRGPAISWYEPSDRQMLPSKSSSAVMRQ